MAAGFCALLVTTACGSTQSDSEKGAATSNTPAANAPASDGDAPAAPAAGGEAQASATPTEAAPAASASAGGATPAAPAAGGASTGAKASSGAAAPSQKTAAGASGGSTAAGGSSGGGGGGSTSGGKTSAGASPGLPSTPGAPAPSGGPKSEIVLGAVGVHSGVIGDILAPIEHGARAWTADVNARGGLNGHPVRLIIADDGGDPGNAVAIGRKLIEQDKIAAFYAEQAPGTLQAYIPLAEKANIPIFGACSCNPDAAASPNMFTATLSPFNGMNWSHTMPAAHMSQAKKVSVFYCREVAICSKGAKDIQDKVAPYLGLQVVHQANVSMAAPDYTAEVLAARNAGAEAIITYVENPTTIRIIRSAKRQGWKPIISAQMSDHDERIIKYGKEDAEGILIGASMLHWDDPRMADFKTAMAKYVPGGILASFAENSWVNGKFIEVLAKSFGDVVTGKDFLKALHSVQGETVGGLVPPLTFKEGVDHDATNLCAYPTTIKNGKFVQEPQYYCPPGWKPGDAKAPWIK